MTASSDWRARPHTEMDATADKPRMVFPDPVTWRRWRRWRIDQGWISRNGKVVTSIDELPPNAIPGDRQVDPHAVAPRRPRRRRASRGR